MECSCEIAADFDGGDFSQFQYEKKLTARKEHRCSECGGKILQGEEYELAGGVMDGRWWKNKTCPVCMELRGTFFPSGWLYGKIIEEIEIYIYEVGGVPESCLSAVTPKARAVLCDMIEKQFEDDC